MSASSRRRWLGTAFAIASGLAIAWLDSRPGFDAVGITVVGLVVAAALAVVLAEARALALAALLGVLTGAWVPLFEIGGSAGAASLAAVMFAVAGALGGVAVIRVLSASPGNGGFTVR